LVARTARRPDKLRWLAPHQSVVTAPIIGANSVAQLRESLDVAGYRLDSSEMTRLNELTKYPATGGRSGIDRNDAAEP